MTDTVLEIVNLTILTRPGLLPTSYPEEAQQALQLLPTSIVDMPNIILPTMIVSPENNVQQFFYNKTQIIIFRYSAWSASLLQNLGQR